MFAIVTNTRRKSFKRHLFWLLFLVYGYLDPWLRAWAEENDSHRKQVGRAARLGIAWSRVRERREQRTRSILPGPPSNELLLQADPTCSFLPSPIFSLLWIYKKNSSFLRSHPLGHTQFSEVHQLVTVRLLRELVVSSSDSDHSKRLTVS